MPGPFHALSISVSTLPGEAELLELLARARREGKQTARASGETKGGGEFENDDQLPTLIADPETGEDSTLSSHHSEMHFRLLLSPSPSPLHSHCQPSIHLVFPVAQNKFKTFFMRLPRSRLSGT